MFAANAHLVIVLLLGEGTQRSLLAESVSAGAACNLNGKHTGHLAQHCAEACQAFTACHNKPVEQLGLHQLASLQTAVPDIHLILHGHRGQPGPIDQSAHNKLVAFSNEAHGRAEMVGLVLAL